jgi:hypothetical protein
MLRIPHQVELMGLDTAAGEEILADEKSIIEAERNAIGGG